MASFIVLLTLCHWKQLRKPYFALTKLLIIFASLFGLSTLPWQQNFAGLIGGFMFGGGLTIAIVPFVYITKYSRKAKVIFIDMIFILFYANILFYFPRSISSGHAFSCSVWCMQRCSLCSMYFRKSCRHSASRAHIQTIISTRMVFREISMITRVCITIRMFSMAW